MPVLILDLLLFRQRERGVNIAAIIRSAAEHCDKYYIYGWMARSVRTDRTEKGDGRRGETEKSVAVVAPFVVYLPPAN